MFGGEVESLTVAEVEGVGVGVVVDGRQGYRVGRLARRRRRRRDARRRARQRGVRRRPTSAYGLATPADVDGVGAADARPLARRRCSQVPTEEKVALALELERATKAADPRIRGVESADYGDAALEAAIANSLGVEASIRRTTCSVSAVALAGDGTGTQTGYGFVAGRTLADLDLDSGRARRPPSASTPAARRHASRRPRASR